MRCALRVRLDQDALNRGVMLAERGGAACESAGGAREIAEDVEVAAGLFEDLAGVCR